MQLPSTTSFVVLFCSCCVARVLYFLLLLPFRCIKVTYFTVYVSFNFLWHVRELQAWFQSTLACRVKANFKTSDRLVPSRLATPQALLA